MSVGDPDVMDSEVDNASEHSIKDDEATSVHEDGFPTEGAEFDKEEPSKCGERYPPANFPRPPRGSRFQGPMSYRPGNRPPFPGYRGPRMPMHMPGNHGPGFMRPGMGPNRNGPPFDGYGPHPMGMPRGPPRHFQQCYNPGLDNHDEDNDESYCEMNHDFDAPQGNPNMRPRGPYMMGPHGGPLHNMPHGGPPGAPPNGPFHGPPRAQYGGPPFNPHGGPSAGSPFGPPGPHHGNAPPGPYGGPPGPNSMGREHCFGGPGPAPQEFNGQPGPNYGPPGHFNAPYPGGPPPFAPPRPPYGSAPPGTPNAANPPSSGPLLPPPNMSPANASSTGACPPPNVQNPPPGSPFSAATDAVNQPGFPGSVPPFAPVRPPSGFQNVPSTAAASAVPVNGSASVPPTSQPSSCPPGSIQAPASENSHFVPPSGYQNAVSMVPPPMMMPQPMAPAGVPLHMMPPPMQAIPVAPPSIPAFRPPVPFMPPTSTASSTQKASDEIWVENLTAEGKSYYYNMRTRETRWDRPEGVTVVRQGEVETAAKPASFAIPMGGQTMLQKPPDVAVWSEYRNPEGKAYYHNAQTGETTWEKPKVLSNWEAFQSKASMQSNMQPVSSQPVSIAQTTPKSDEKPVAVINTTAGATEAKTSNDAKLDPTKSEHTAASKGSVTGDNADEKTQTKAPKDSSRPVSSTPVPGTPWCVVWTGDDRAFFFNPSQRLSVWEKPDELKGRADVDRLLEKRPDAVTKPEVEQSDKAPVDEQNDEVPAKKPRLEEEESVTTVEDTESKSKPMECTESETDKPPTDKIPVGMEAAREAEERAARERATQPLELRVRRFRELLVEKQVSAFSTWEKELHKIVFDPRYLLLTSKERRQTFEIYVKERAEDERREKKNKMKERREKFLEMLEEANLSVKSSFSDFCSKYSKDERFKAVEKSRERESLFQDYLADIRKREKEDKHREKDDKQREKKKKSDFMDLLKEQKSITRHSHWSDVKRKIDSDPRYKAVETSSRREDWFRDYLKKLDEPSPTREDSGSRREREKRERQEASIREREREVKEALSSSLKERETEREQQMLIEQRQNFQAMLAELIRDPSITWKESKKILKKDSRWELVSDVLQRSERDRIFEEHLENLSRKVRDLKGLNDTYTKDKRSMNDTESVDSDRRSTSSLKDGDRR